MIQQIKGFLFVNIYYYQKIFRVVTPEEGEFKAKELETLFMEVCAKSGYNINNLFQMIAIYLPGNEFHNKFLTTERKFKV